MKALTLYQPWATLVARGLKTIETRSWNTSYRGWLLIHAGKTFDVPYAAWLNSVSPYRELTKDFAYPLGFLVCKVYLRDCQLIRVENLPGSIERKLGDYTAGRYQWIFGVIIPFDEPIPATGHQGLWNYPDKNLPG